MLVEETTVERQEVNVQSYQVLLADYDKPITQILK